MLCDFPDQDCFSVTAVLPQKALPSTFVPENDWQCMRKILNVSKAQIPHEDLRHPSFIDWQGASFQWFGDAVGPFALVEAPNLIKNTRFEVVRDLGIL